MKFTIITPTIRPHILQNCIDQVENQTYSDWQHLIAIDPPLTFTEKSKDERRRIITCSRSHRDFGNTCRQFATFFAKGDYIVYLDDDNIMYPNCLEQLNNYLSKNSDYSWGYWKMLYDSQTDKSRILFPDEIRTDNIMQTDIDTGQIFHRRLIKGKPVRWHDGKFYAAEKLLILKLLTEFDVQPFRIPEILSEHPKHGNLNYDEIFRK